MKIRLVAGLAVMQGGSVAGMAAPVDLTEGWIEPWELSGPLMLQDRGNPVEYRNIWNVG